MEMNRRDADLRRRWTLILPAVFVTYSLAYLDRANYGFGAAAGLAKTLHISGYQSSLLGSLFFLGYFLPQMPGDHSAAAEQRTVDDFWRRWWRGAAFAALTGVIRRLLDAGGGSLSAGRGGELCVSGDADSADAVVYAAERSRANSLLMLGNPLTVLWMSAVTGFLIRAWGWQRAFIVEGAMAVVWGVVWLAVMRDWPREARWMSSEAAVRRWRAALAREQVTLPRMATVAGVSRRRTWCGCAQIIFSGAWGFMGLCCGCRW